VYWGVEIAPESDPVFVGEVSQLREWVKRYPEIPHNLSKPIVNSEKEIRDTDLQTSQTT
jgi:hypothetical protein